jgi:RNA polymerase sigma-70 factor, ECF subfamily
MQLYVDHFNRRDWDGVRELISADARLTVADRFAGKFGEAPYFFNYDRWPWPWKLAVGELDGEPVVIILQRGADTWTPLPMDDSRSCVCRPPRENLSAVSRMSG